MTNNPFETVAQISALVSAELDYHPGLKFPTHTLHAARSAIARLVHEEAYAARKELEEIDSEYKLLNVAWEVGMHSEPASQPSEDSNARELVDEWISHLSVAQKRAIHAKHQEVTARHELWQELAKICDKYLGLGQDDWVFD